MHELQLLDEYDMNEADIVDSDDFWLRVEMAMILRGFPGHKIQAFDIKPNLLDWAPFIGRKTRKSSVVYNIEHRKVGRHDGKLEKDCQEITEERLVELLNNSSLKEIQSLSNSLGCKGKGSKLDLVMQIKNALFPKTIKNSKRPLTSCGAAQAGGYPSHALTSLFIH